MRGSRKEGMDEGMKGWGRRMSEWMKGWGGWMSEWVDEGMGWMDEGRVEVEGCVKRLGSDHMDG